MLKKSTIILLIIAFAGEEVAIAACDPERVSEQGFLGGRETQRRSGHRQCRQGAVGNAHIHDAGELTGWHIVRLNVADQTLESDLS